MAIQYTGGGSSIQVRSQEREETPQQNLSIVSTDRPAMFQKTSIVKNGTSNKIFDVSSADGTSGSATEPIPRKIEIHNKGGVPIFALSGYETYSDETTGAGATRYLHTMVMPGETFAPPVRALISTEGASTQFDGTAVSNNSVPAVAGALKITTSNTIASGEFNNTDDPVVFELSGDHERFRVGDKLRISDEIVRVEGTFDDNPTEQTLADHHIVVSRGHNGSTIAAVASTPTVFFWYGNDYHNFDKYTVAQTDGTGRFKATHFFAQARAASGNVGLVPGSIALKFFNAGYVNCNMSGITSSTKTGLAASTEYKFNITVDGGSTFVDLAFTTDASNGNFGGTNGLIQKIQEALDVQFYTAGSNLFEKKVKVGIVNGDLRFTSGSHLSTSTVELAAPGSGTTPFGVGRLPAVPTANDSVPARLPDDNTYNNRTYSTEPNTDVFMYDDGEGNLFGMGVGTINYETGAIEFSNAPVNAEFVISYAKNSAFSGKLNEGTTGRINSIKEILVNTPSAKWDGLVEIKAFE